MPNDIDYSTLTVMQRNDDNLAPKLLYQGLTYKGIYTRRMNDLGKDWSTSDWLQVESHTKAMQIESILAYGEYVWYWDNWYGQFIHEEIIMVKFLNDNNIPYKLTGDNDSVQLREAMYGFDDGTWRAYQININIFM